MRRLYLLLIAVGIMLFVGISALLARAFSVDGAERTAVGELLREEARGDARAIVARIAGCRDSAGCRARAAQNALALVHRGEVSIIQLQGSPSFALSGSTGTDRVAWTVGGSLPIVQCVRVRRAGSVLSGFRIALLEVSARIKSDADCPRSF